MLEEQWKGWMETFHLKNEKAITFGHPKMKCFLPLPGVTLYSFEQEKPFFIYFDEDEIRFFPLDLNHKYRIIGKFFISWNDLKNFHLKKDFLWKMKYNYNERMEK